jgi:hypothetical protein
MLTTKRFVTGSMMVGLLAGCGSGSQPDPFGPEPDYGAIKAQLDHPTGTFAPGTEKTVLSTYSSQQTSASTYSFGSATQTSGQANGTANSWCSAMAGGQTSGSCSCPNGGSLVYDIPTPAQSSQSIDVTEKARFQACIDQGVTLDGTEFVHVHESTASGAQQPSDFWMILDAHLTATTQGMTEQVVMDALFDTSGMWISISVNDGSVAVGLTASGTAQGGATYTVRDRNETWTCTVNNGAGSCTSSLGNTRQF